LVRFHHQAIIVIPSIPYFVQVNVDNSQVLYHLINKYKLNRGIILKLGLKVPLGIPCGSTKEVKHLGFFKKEMVVVNIKLFLYLNPPILKGRVYPVR